MSVYHLSPGDEVVYCNFDKGDELDRKTAQQSLDPFRVYTLSTVCSIGRHSTVTLNEVGGTYSAFLFEPKNNFKRAEPSIKLDAADIEALAEILEKPSTLRLIRAAKGIYDIFQGVK